MESLAAFLKERTRTSVIEAPLILVGDLNCGVGEPDYEAFVQAANLRRLMTIRSRLDHILGQATDAHVIEVIGTVPIKQKFNAKGTADRPERSSSISVHGDDYTKEVIF